ncbi:hypothetical protein CLOM_g4241 [Closterium sp. NIES-68]|nr:hypothetical protein CLOM_g4241 [Closterium sp. NIES-68]GJP69271.1 hypothetical protein CLOP_g215 [Closterium sp. NIES-67]
MWEARGCPAELQRMKTSMRQVAMWIPTPGSASRSALSSGAGGMPASSLLLGCRRRWRPSPQRVTQVTWSLSWRRSQL